MENKVSIIVLICIIASLLFLLIPKSVRADEISDIEQKLGELKKALEMSINATTPLEKNLDKLQANLDSIKTKILFTEKDISAKEAQVTEGEKLLVLAQELLSSKVRTLYKNFSSAGNSWHFLISSNMDDAVRQLGYQKKVIQNDRDNIVKVVLYIKDIEAKKKQLESEKSRLAIVKAETDEQAAFLEKEIGGAKKFQKELSRQIASLSQRQQDLLAQKLASLNLPTSLGAGPLYCVDDRKIDPGFSPAFAFFTYGIPHRVGLNQYGALGRAKDGQNHRDILNAYYSGISFEKKDPNLTIRVQGHGEKKLDEYMLGIYEMPGDWPLEALKAQAVAARSYAYAYTGGGANEICTTQACQVYKGGNKGGRWEEAVRATEGEVMVSGGEVVKAWYASTFGGYTFTSGDVWGSDRSYTKRSRDTRGEIGSFGDLAERSYDRESPCFYAAQGARSEYGKSAWLKEEEAADIINVLLLAKNDSSTQKHLSQEDKPNPDGEETWDKNKVKQELKNRGITPYERISNISVDWDKGMGKTNTVSVSGNGGNISFDAGEFKNFFNLRAPANIQIVGPLYNIERK